MADIEAQVLVLGLGPAGRAVAHRLAVRGIDVVVCSIAPARRWTPTYGAWEDELPGWLPRDTVASRVTGIKAYARTTRTLARTYVVFDTPGLQHALDLDEVRVVDGTVTAADASGARLADGRRLRANVVLDARGLRPERHRAQQTAFGYVVDTERAAPADGPWFMDWRRDNGTGPTDQPSFLYAVPLGGGRTLLEETCLVGRPAIGLGELRRRLHRRLDARGVTLTGAEPIERVRFSVESGCPPDPEPVTIGARGGLMHPATGYSVGASLALADVIADAVAAGSAPQAALWPRRARLVDQLRAAGLRTLLSLPSDSVEDFFEAFFALSARRQQAYLSGRENPGALLVSMAGMAQGLPLPLVGVAVRSVLPDRPERRLSRAGHAG